MFRRQVAMCMIAMGLGLLGGLVYRSDRTRPVCHGAVERHVDDAAPPAGSPPPPRAFRLHGWGTIDGATRVADLSSYVLETSLDPSYSDGSLSIDRKAYPLEAVRLQVVSTRVEGSSIITDYALQFSIDVCLYQQPTTGWPGPPCGYWAHDPRPRHLQPFELRLEQQSESWEPGWHIDSFDASCVPSSGHGPACFLAGSRGGLADR